MEIKKCSGMGIRCLKVVWGYLDPLPRDSDLHLITVCQAMCYIGDQLIQTQVPGGVPPFPFYKWGTGICPWVQSYVLEDVSLGSSESGLLITAPKAWCTKSMHWKWVVPQPGQHPLPVSPHSVLLSIAGEAEEDPTITTVLTTSGWAVLPGWKCTDYQGTALCWASAP